MIMFLRKILYQLYFIVAYKYHREDILDKLDQRIEACQLSVNKKIFNCQDSYLLSDIDFNVPGLKKISDIKLLKKDKIKNSVFHIYFNEEEKAVQQINKIIKGGGIFIPLIFNTRKSIPYLSSTTSYRFTNAQCLKSIKETYSKFDQISHFHPNSIKTHENICEALEITKNLKGDFVEIGVYKGGSALTALNYINISKSKRKLYLLDTFSGFNYINSRKSKDQVWHQTHLNNNKTEFKKKIRQTLGNYKNYFILENDITKDLLPNNIKKISVAHIDVDLYEATFQALVKISPKIVVGGIIMCEDPVSTPGTYGSLVAMKKFLKSQNGKNYTCIFKTNHYFLIKNKNFKQKY